VRAFLAMLDAQIEPTPLPVSGETRLPDAA
jgi:hypothetical protein